MDRLDLKRDAGQVGGNDTIARHTVIGNKVNSIFSKLQGPHLNLAYQTKVMVPKDYDEDS